MMMMIDTNLTPKILECCKMLGFIRLWWVALGIEAVSFCGVEAAKDKAESPALLHFKISFFSSMCCNKVTPKKNPLFSADFVDDFYKKVAILPLIEMLLCFWQFRFGLFHCL